MKHLVAVVVLGLGLTSAALADSWFHPRKKIETAYRFGRTRIVQVYDGRARNAKPRYAVEVYHKGRLQATLEGVGVEGFFASSDHSWFVGLSNDGIPGTAVVLFDNQGKVLLKVEHDTDGLEYCTQSVTIVREWFSDENPDVRFVPAESGEGYEAVTVRDCKGGTIDLLTKFRGRPEG